MTTQVLVFALCLLTSAFCAVLLFRAFWASERRFLLWCGVAFVFLAINNALVLIDIFLFPNVSLGEFRQGAALFAVAVLIYGFMWEVE